MNISSQKNSCFWTIWSALKWTFETSQKWHWHRFSDEPEMHAKGCKAARGRARGLDLHLPPRSLQTIHTPDNHHSSEFTSLNWDYDRWNQHFKPVSKTEHWSFQGFSFLAVMSTFQQCCPRCGKKDKKPFSKIKKSNQVWPTLTWIEQAAMGPPQLVSPLSLKGSC